MYEWCTSTVSQRSFGDYLCIISFAKDLLLPYLVESFQGFSTEIGFREMCAVSWVDVVSAWQTDYLHFCESNLRSQREN